MVFANRSVCVDISLDVHVGEALTAGNPAAWQGLGASEPACLQPSVPCFPMSRYVEAVIANVLGILFLQKVMLFVCITFSPFLFT